VFGAWLELYDARRICAIEQEESEEEEGEEEEGEEEDRARRRRARARRVQSLIAQGTSVQQRRRRSKVQS
jgi:hypothetical protein